MSRYKICNVCHKTLTADTDAVFCKHCGNQLNYVEGSTTYASGISFDIGPRVKPGD